VEAVAEPADGGVLVGADLGVVGCGQVVDLVVVDEDRFGGFERAGALVAPREDGGVFAGGAKDGRGEVVAGVGEDRAVGAVGVGGVNHVVDLLVWAGASPQLWERERPGRFGQGRPQGERAKSRSAARTPELCALTGSDGPLDCGHWGPGWNGPVPAQTRRALRGVVE